MSYQFYVNASGRGEQWRRVQPGNVQGFVDLQQVANDSHATLAARKLEQAARSGQWAPGLEYQPVNDRKRVAAEFPKAQVGWLHAQEQTADVLYPPGVSGRDQSSCRLALASDGDGQDPAQPETESQAGGGRADPGEEE